MSQPGEMGAAGGGVYLSGTTMLHGVRISGSLD